MVPYHNGLVDFPVTEGYTGSNPVGIALANEL